MPTGYARLASLMGAHPETAIVRRFGSLNTLNLLYLQAELTDLENALQKEAKADAESGHLDRTLYSQGWQNQALHLQHKIAKIGPPNRQDFEFLQRWMSSPSMGNVYLLGADSDIWEIFDPAELVALYPDMARKPDASAIHGDIARYSQGGVERMCTVVGTVLGSLLLVGSILVLYSVGSMEMRLMTIGIFTSAFSLSLCLLTNGRMVEVFSATAA
ncbi:hypothetical protein B0T26DRAFT_748959 [Lasiosphaeria miniovina]|uniref:DUF6594 domain-containing protein n=1 Tax=Lasiosphaeria miniovina TaxID=1954250 RepID=A0AA40B7H6_9PEZI|nr:uncharacterized protein B0T26DRAFT_748959 [Lasiosphaeria miniovina]KAK0728798.1 hypothetical protein B0T26DRAFT_748959 [Lasiosphaeria miniovina]